MIPALKPYPAYRDSGVPWLGQVPEHWQVRRMRNAVEMRVSNVDKHTSESELPVRLCNYTDVYRNDRITRNGSFMRATATAEEIERFRLEIGDVLITKDSEAWNDIGVPALIEYTAADLVCGYHLALLRSRKAILSGAYLFRVLQSPAIAYQFHVAANGVTRYGLSHEAIKSVVIPLPPLSEQTAITRFLDYVDRRIRRYIRAKQKLIALLEEQKQAIIHRAVTRGLDPSVRRLKPSDVEWLGDVPEHWNEYTIGQVAESLQTGPFGSQLHASDYVPGGIPVINPIHLRNGRILSDDKFAVSDSMAQKLSRHKLELGDIVIGRRGELGRCGLVGSAEVGWLCGTGSMRLRPKPGFFHPEYLLLLLTSKGVREFLSLSSVGATMENLNTLIVSRVRLPCPPIAEQERIAAFVAQSSAATDQVTDRAQREIALLREYRTRLIADVVTGKLDVRQAAARLPEEAEEVDPEPLAADEGEENAGDESLDDAFAEEEP